MNGLDEAPTYSLIRDWIESEDLHERYHASGALNGFWFWLLRRPFINEAGLRDATAALWSAVTTRYDGVVRDWFHQARVNPSDAKSVAMQVHLNALSDLKSQWPVRPPSVPVALCRALSSEVGTDRGLARKFYLRAFVDETPNARARAVVTQRVYGGRSGTVTVKELREHLVPVCTALHARLQSLGPDVDIWTTRQSPNGMSLTPRLRLSRAPLMPPGCCCCS